MDVGPILKVFDALMTAGATLSLGATGFFVMLAGYQYLSAGGSVRAVESAKSSLYNALIGFAIVIMCKIIAGLVGGALGAPGAGSMTTGMVLGPAALMLPLLG
jgi:hypothetical protein